MHKLPPNFIMIMMIVWMFKPGLLGVMQGHEIDDYFLSFR